MPSEQSMPTYDEIIRRFIPQVEFHQNRYARGLSDCVRPGSRWLDIGAGTMLHSGWIGVKANEIADRADLLIGCDLVEEHLSRNTQLDAATVANATLLPFRDESFDVVSANMVLEHLEAPELVFAEVARVLARNGRFVFVTPNKNNPIVRGASLLLSRRVRKLLAHSVEGRSNEHIFHTFYRANSPSRIRQLATVARLRADTIETFNSYPFLRRFWVLTVLESFWIKVISLRPLKQFTTNLFGVLLKD